MSPTSVFTPLAKGTAVLFRFRIVTSWPAAREASTQGNEICPEPPT